MSMAERKLNLRLPITKERPSSERPSSRTDKLVEDSFIYDIPNNKESSRLVTSSSYTSLSSVSKIKDILEKTSSKLKSIQNKKKSATIKQNESSEKNIEIAKLKREIKILEMEK